MFWSALNPLELLISAAETPNRSLAVLNLVQCRRSMNMMFWEEMALTCAFETGWWLRHCRQCSNNKHGSLNHKVVKPGCFSAVPHDKRSCLECKRKVFTYLPVGNHSKALLSSLCEVPYLETYKWIFEKIHLQPYLLSWWQILYGPWHLWTRS